jgi:hypothetical protein
MRLATESVHVTACSAATYFSCRLPPVTPSSHRRAYVPRLSLTSPSPHAVHGIRDRSKFPRGSVASAWIQEVVVATSPPTNLGRIRKRACHHAPAPSGIDAACHRRGSGAYGSGADRSNTGGLLRWGTVGRSPCSLYAFPFGPRRSIPSTLPSRRIPLSIYSVFREVT